MFQSVNMRKIEIVVSKQDVVPVTEALAASGVFQPISPEWGSEKGEDEEWTAWKNQFTDLERRVLKVLKDLGGEAGEPPEKPPHLIDPHVAQRAVAHIETEIQQVLGTLERVDERIGELQQYMDQLRPIAELDVDLDTLRNMKHVFVLPGTMPTDRIERFSESLGHLPFVLVVLKRGSYLSTVVLFGDAQDAEILKRAARSAYLNPVHIPGHYQGTPAEVLEALEVGMKRAQQHRAEVRAEIDALYQTHGEQLHSLLWRMRASRTMVSTIARYERFHYTYMITGWVPQTCLKELETQLEEVSDNLTVEVLEPRPRFAEDEAPVALENPPLLRAFQPLVTTYAYPEYRELDPTLLVALTYPLIFGMMFGDLGHGLLLALLGLFLSRSKAPALGRVAMICGGSAMLFGLLYGSVFGFESVLSPLWQSPLDDINAILLTAVKIGVGLLSLGMVANMLNAARTRRWGALFFDAHGLVGLLFYWSLVGLAFTQFGQGVGKPFTSVLIGCAAVSGLGVVFSAPLQRLVAGENELFEEGVGTFIPLAFFELFETLLSFLSNTLSYVRMGAFAVAHGALSLTVFILAETIGPAKGAGYWLMVALGNLFVVGFEGMVVAIQTLRLEYYEFFTKFFSGGGRPFKPLAFFSGD
ncbi:MAG: V-type ATP synthase subunit I [Anaerolineae bacterium]